MRLRYAASRSSRKRWRPKCEDYLRLDIRELSRGQLRAGRITCLFLACARSSQPILTHLESEEQSIVVSFYEQANPITKTLAKRIRVRLDRTPCNFGSSRSWLICPRCKSRRAVLYAFADDGNFGCWGCMDLVYKCQDERKLTRLWRKQRNLERRINNESGKPKGMHWKTFSAICRRAEQVIFKQESLFIDGARALLQKKATLSKSQGNPSPSRLD